MASTTNANFYILNTPTVGGVYGSRSGAGWSSLGYMQSSSRAPLYCFLWVTFALALVSLGFAVLWDRLGRPNAGISTLYPTLPLFDFYDYIDRLGNRGSASFFMGTGYLYPWYYPAPAFLVSYPFLRIARWNMTGGAAFFIGMTILLNGAVAALFCRKLRSEGLRSRDAVLFCFGTAALSWPVYFAIQRGNIEGLTWLLVAAVVWAHQRGKIVWAGCLIGLAGAIKLYPLLLAYLLLRRRSGRAILAGSCVFVGVTAAGLLFLEPNIANAAIQTVHGVKAWTLAYGGTFRPVFDHSAFELVKWCNPGNAARFVYEMHRFYIVAGLLSLGAAIKAWRMGTVNQVLFLTCAMVTLPPVSFDYTLAALYVPVGMIALLAVRGSGNLKVLSLTMALLSVLIGPLSFLNFGHTTGTPGAVRAVLLLATMVISICVPLERSGYVEQRCLDSRHR